MSHLNEGLIGVPGGRARLQTPALVIDLDAFERNVAKMVAHAKKVGVGLRPHAKTHKSAEIARVVALNGRMRELILVCDNADVARRIDSAAHASGKKLKVLVDIDPGM